MGHRPMLSDELYAAAETVKEEHQYANIDRALKHMVREGGYEV